METTFTVKCRGKLCMQAYYMYIYKCTCETNRTRQSKIILAICSCLFSCTISRPQCGPVNNISQAENKFSVSLNDSQMPFHTSMETWGKNKLCCKWLRFYFASAPYFHSYVDLRQILSDPMVILLLFRLSQMTEMISSTSHCESKFSCLIFFMKRIPKYYTYLWLINLCIV